MPLIFPKRKLAGRSIVDSRIKGNTVEESPAFERLAKHHDWLLRQAIAKFGPRGASPEQKMHDARVALWQTIAFGNARAEGGFERLFFKNAKRSLRMENEGKSIVEKGAVRLDKQGTSLHQSIPDINARPATRRKTAMAMQHLMAQLKKTRIPTGQRIAKRRYYRQLARAGRRERNRIFERKESLKNERMNAALLEKRQRIADYFLKLSANALPAVVRNPLLFRPSQALSFFAAVRRLEIFKERAEAYRDEIRFVSFPPEKELNAVRRVLGRSSAEARQKRLPGKILTREQKAECASLASALLEDFSQRREFIRQFKQGGAESIRDLAANGWIPAEIAGREIERIEFKPLVRDKVLFYCAVSPQIKPYLRNLKTAILREERVSAIFLTELEKLRHQLGFESAAMPDTAFGDPEF